MWDKRKYNFLQVSEGKAKNKVAYQHKNLIPGVKSGGGWSMIWAY